MDDELARYRLDGRVAVVSGASGGIGERLTRAYGAVGAVVALLARSEGRLKELQQQLADDGVQALAVPCDATDRRSAEAAIDEVERQLGRVDVLVNAVGGGAGTALHDAEHYPEEEWDRIVDLNLRSALLVTQPAVRAMIRGGRGGRVLNISSVRGQLGIDAGFSAYVAAKGALDAVTRQWATEWAKHHITVNAISPTFVATPQVADLLADDDFKRGIIARIPLGRVGETDDLVGATLLLTSDAAAFITGQVLTIDGGLTATQ